MEQYNGRTAECLLITANEAAGKIKQPFVLYIVQTEDQLVLTASQHNVLC